MHALLHLMRENEARVQRWAAQCANMLEFASKHLSTLDPEVGEEELIKAVAAELAKLRS